MLFARHTSYITCYASHVTHHTPHVITFHPIAGDTLHSLSQVIHKEPQAASSTAGTTASLNRLLLLNRPPPPSSAYTFLTEGRGGLVQELCWGSVCGLKQVLLLLLLLLLLLMLLLLLHMVCAVQALGFATESNCLLLSHPSSRCPLRSMLSLRLRHRRHSPFQMF